MAPEMPTDRPIVNATTPLEIHVIPADTQLPGRLTFTDCPIARACCRQDPEVEGAWVFLSRLYLVYRDRIERRPTGAAIAREITAVDRGGAFAPGVYVAPACPPSMLHKPTGKQRGRKGGKRPKPQHLTAWVRGR